jgi:hypothetical protein
MWWKTNFMILCSVIYCSLVCGHKRIGEAFSTRVQSQCSKDGDKKSSKLWKDYLYPDCLASHHMHLYYKYTFCQNIKSYTKEEGE